MTSLFLALISFVIVAWGQPHCSSVLSIASSSFGFTLFWVSLLKVPTIRKRFWYGTFWFASVQLIQLSWFASSTYQGTYIYFVYIALCVWLGIQFGILSIFLPKTYPIGVLHSLGVGGVWVLMEWSRLFIFCGFAWNPVGLSLTGCVWGMQLAAVVGIFGLSFLVVVINLLGVNLLMERNRSCVFLYFGALLFPYLFGAIHVGFHERRQRDKDFYRVALVQTALFPDQKQPYLGQEEKCIPPIVQWKRIFRYLQECPLNELDLIVLPECAVPFSSHAPVYPLREIEAVFGKRIGHLETLLKEPFAEKKGGEWFLSNALLSQVLANHYQAEVIIGMDTQDKGNYYNAAFHFSSNKEAVGRYEKRILLPLAEYLPPTLFFFKPLIARYGILDFFTPGKEAKVIAGKYPLTLSICYEECFPYIFREGRRKGAKVFVNLTNDGWYPHSTLPAQHFAHAKIRAIENGAPLLRACNTGITAGIDSLGRTTGCFENGERDCERRSGALGVMCSLYSFSTLYTFWGDWLIICLSIASLMSLKRIPLLKNRF